MLPSKTASSTTQTKSMTCAQQQTNSMLASSKARSSIHASKKSHKATVEDVEDANSPQNISAQNHAASLDPPAATETMTSNTVQRKKVSILMASPTLLTTCTSQKPGRVKHSNPIYLFYKSVPQNSSSQPGDPNDKHYHCCHGNHKILTVTKLMKSNLNGLCIIFASTRCHCSPMFVRAHWSPEALPDNVSALLCTQGPG